MRTQNKGKNNTLLSFPLPVRLLFLWFLCKTVCQREHDVARDGVVAALGVALGVDRVSDVADLMENVVGRELCYERTFHECFGDGSVPRIGGVVYLR